MRGKGVQSLFLKASSLADVIHRRRLKRKTRSGTADPRDAERLGQPGRPRPD